MKQQKNNKHSWLRGFAVVAAAAVFGTMLAVNAVAAPLAHADTPTFATGGLLPKTTIQPAPMSAAGLPASANLHASGVLSVSAVPYPPGAVAGIARGAQVSVVDASGEPASGVPVVFTVTGSATVQATDGSGTPAASVTVSTDATGVARVSVNDETVETTSLSATVSGVAVAGSPQSMRFVPTTGVLLPVTITGVANGIVSGTADPTASVQVIFPDGSVSSAVAVVSNNSWSLPWPKALPVCGQISVQEFVNKGTIDGTASYNTGTCPVKPAPPVVNPTQGVTVTGTAVAGSTVTVTTATGTVVGTGVASSSSAFTVSVNPVQAVGTKLQVTATVTGTGGVQATSDATPVTVLVKSTVGRIQGSDRYATAVAAAAQEFPNGAATVILARGTNYPDAISAAPAAVKLNAPILLTQTDTLTGVTLNELNALRPSKVIVLGDEVSVSRTVLAQVQSVSTHPSVVRIAGPDRYATNRALVSYVWGSGATTVFVATGQNFTDAESASSAAAASGAPLVLVNGNKTVLDSATTGVLRGLGAVTIHVVGSTTNLTGSLYTGLAGIGASDRTSGVGPVSQASAVARVFFPKAASVYVASTDDYPDALVAGALAGRAGVPVLFTADSLSAGVSADIISLGATRVYVMGDATRITATAYSALQIALGITG